MQSLFKPWALGAMASALLVACGGGDAPAAAADAGRASALAAASPSGSSYRVAVSERTTMTRIDRRLRQASGPVDVWVSLEQNSVAAQQALLAEAAGLTDRKAVRNAPAVRAAVKEHGQRVRSAQSGMAAQLGMLGAKELGRVQQRAQRASRCASTRRS